MKLGSEHRVRHDPASLEEKGFGALFKGPTVAAWQLGLKSLIIVLYVPDDYMVNRFLAQFLRIFFKTLSPVLSVPAYRKLNNNN